MKLYVECLLYPLFRVLTNTPAYIFRARCFLALTSRRHSVGEEFYLDKWAAPKGREERYIAAPPPSQPGREDDILKTNITTCGHSLEGIRMCM